MEKYWVQINIVDFLNLNTHFIASILLANLCYKEAPEFRIKFDKNPIYYLKYFTNCSWDIPNSTPGIRNHLFVGIHFSLSYCK